MSIFRGILIVLTFHVSSALADVEIGGTGLDCADDPACINRMHPDIPIAARAAPGERIIMRGRDAGDMHLDPDAFSVAETSPDWPRLA